ncbi:hypothetical protein HNP48_000198 [Acidovorax soli]|uniref:Phage integrase family protein n=1 Tax=Acidovorax soli TaxID=592050 RepID=A0A7X0U7C0_9BURK|nr:hypothetical protein [Acidovorax soli]MBB6557534.1 hypothetical protein [Acidovorax soli]
MRYEFHAAQKVHQTVYEKVAVVDLVGSGLSPGSWVIAAVGRAAEASRRKPTESAIPNMYQQVFSGLALNMDWLRCARVTPDELTVELLVNAMRHVDDFVASKMDRSQATRSQLSYHVRKLLRDFGVYQQVDRVSRLGVMYRTPHSTVGASGRRMISDAVLHGSDVPHPLGAVPFNTAYELQSKFNKKIEDTLTTIASAALSEIDSLTASNAVLEEILSRYEAENFVLERVKLQFSGESKSFTKPYFQWIEDQSVSQLAAAYYRACRDALLQKSDEKFQPRILRANEILRWLGENGYQATGSSDLAYIFMSCSLLNQRALLGCLIILQIHTGWNVNSILEMKLDGIQGNGKGGYIIQGFKARIGEETPFSEVLASDVNVVRVIELLTGRLEALQNLGWAPFDERRLWLNARYARNGKLRQFVGWGSSLHKFCKRHNLPQFSAEQIRNEVIGSHTTSKGGLEAARQVAGHASIATTAHYADQLILHRINSAYALEFEGRLEKSVRFRMGDFPNFDLEEDLLYPIGDGSSCSDPYNPPEPEYLEYGVCAGKSCHEGDGCVNRRLIIDRARIEEIFRTQVFYLESWRDLLSGNKELFRKMHVPAMMVNFALVDILLKSAYRHVAKQIKEEVTMKGVK